MSPWFAPDWRERYATHFRRYLALYAIAKAAGRKLTPDDTRAWAEVVGAKVPRLK